MTTGKEIGAFSTEDEQAQTLLRPTSVGERADSLADGPADMDIEERERGHILVHRQIQQSEVWLDPPLLKVFLWCIFKAAWRDRWVSVSTGRGFVSVHLLVGQFIFGRHTAAEALNMPGSSVEDRMARLVKMGCITVAPVTHYSIVTVCKYEPFQKPQENGRHPSVTHPSPIRHPSVTKNTLETGKEGKEVRQQPRSPKSATEIPDALKTPEFLEAWAAWHGYCKEKRNPLKPTTERYQLRKLAKAGSAGAVAMITQSIESNWQGLFPVKENANVGTGKHRSGVAEIPYARKGESLLIK